MAPMAMFPLGTVPFVGEVLPLHVFEPRYRALVHHCVEGDGAGEFGVVLIERGSEVGGGDVRSDAGTVVRIADATQLPDGRWLLATVGDRRIRVQRWLPDDPHPWAEVEDWPDDPSPGPGDERYEATAALLRRVLALRNELGDPGPPSTVDLSDDASVGTAQLCALAPVGPFDRQRLLVAPSLSDRLDLLHSLLQDEKDVLELRLSG